MLQPKPNIQYLQPVAHGGINRSELTQLGLAESKIIDFSVSTNPFGAPPGLAEEMCRVPVETYPDSESTDLIAALAGRLGLSPENLVVGSGSTELIRLAASAYLGPGDRVIIPEPAYGDYELACSIVGAAVIKITAAKDEGFNLDLAALQKMIREEKPRAIFICNPNNPTGLYLSRKEIVQILSAAPDCLLVLDEAYIAFTDDPWPSLDILNSGNLIILRSMTKDYALAGLRLGYAAAHKSIISTLKKVRPPWNVSSVAQRAGIFALNNSTYLEDCRLRLKKSKTLLITGLQEMGLKPLPSRSNFFLVEVNDPAGLRHALFKKGLLIRDCASFGLPGYVRLAARSEEDCRILLKQLKAELSSGRKL